MLEKELIIKNKLGMHARPSSVLVQAASKFKSEIIIEKENRKINAKSILDIMMLAAEFGTKIKLIINGNDEKEALEEISTLFENKFNEE